MKMNKIPFLKPNVVRFEEYSEHLKSIDENHLYSNFGPLNTLLEKRLLAEYFDGVGSVTTVANATLGLVLAISQCRRPGARYAVMPSFTFAAAPLAAQWCGLEPYFVDIREDDWCVDDAMLTDTVAALGDQVAVVMPYATFGTNLDLAPYRKLHEAGVPVVIDAAASFGASDPDGTFGKAFPGPVVFSFHATKAFGIGEGGLVHSGDAQLIERLRQASNFGFSAARECTQMGINAKLSEYAAAIGLATLDVFQAKIGKRLEIRQWYIDALGSFGLFDDGWSVQQIEGIVPIQFMPALCPDGQSNQRRVADLARRGIDARTYFSPACHQQPQFDAAPRTAMTVTEQVAERVISLPLWEEMPSRDVNRIVQGLCRS